MPNFYEIFAIIYTEALYNSDNLAKKLVFNPVSDKTSDLFTTHEYRLDGRQERMIEAFVTRYTRKDITLPLAQQIAQLDARSKKGQAIVKSVLEEHQVAMELVKNGWAHVVKRLDLHKAFDQFLMDNNLDVASKIQKAHKAHAQEQAVKARRTCKDKAGGGDKEAGGETTSNNLDQVYPTPTAALGEKDKVTLHKWVFGDAEDAWSLGEDGNQVPERKFWLVTWSLWNTSWTRNIKAHKHLQAATERDLQTIQGIWNKFMDKDHIKTVGDCKRYLTLLKKSLQGARVLRDVQRESKLLKYHQKIKDFLEKPTMEAHLKHGIAKLSATKMKNVAQLLSPKEVEGIKESWKHFLENPQIDTLNTVATKEIITLDSEQVLGSTIGMAAVSSLSKQELLNLLGAHPSDCGALPMMNQARPINVPKGYSDSAVRAAQRIANSQFKEKGEYEDWVPLTLRWDQLAGVYQQLTTWARPSQGSPGFLNADDVGMGKSAQVIASICLYAYWVDLMAEGKKLPDIYYNAGGKDYLLYGHTKIESRPHLILCPNGLVDHWKKQLSMWAGPYLEVHNYVGTYHAHEHYFKEFVYSSRWSESSVPLHRRVIVATYSALQSDARELLQSRQEDMEKYDATSFTSAGNVEGASLLQVKFSTTSLDEGQELRTGGASYEGALVIRDNSLIVSLYSATPVLKGIPDLYQIGYFLRIPSLLEKNSVEQEKTSIANSRATRSAEGKLRASIKDQSPNLDHALVSDLIHATSKTFQDIVTIRKALDGHLICRSRALLTSYSQNADTIPPYKESVLHIDLSKKERKIYNELFDSTGDNLFIPKLEVLAASKSFHNCPRQAALNAEVASAMVKQTPPPPLYVSRQDFYNRGSTKEKVAVQIVLHYIRGAKTTPLLLRWNDGALGTMVTAPTEKQQADWTKVNKEVTEKLLTKGYSLLDKPPKKDQEQRSHLPGTVIYSEFVAPLRYLYQALHLQNIRVGHLQGSLGIKKRESLIEDFNEAKLDVLLLSSVGKVGINLHCGSVVIIMDPLFSHEDTYQVIGRVWREPNRKEVHVYRLLAKDTADLQVEHIAEHKQKLAFAFREGTSLDPKVALDSFFGQDVVTKVYADEGEVTQPEKQRKRKRVASIGATESQPSKYKSKKIIENSDMELDSETPDQEHISSPTMTQEVDNEARLPTPIPNASGQGILPEGISPPPTVASDGHEDTNPASTDGESDQLVVRKGSSGYGVGRDTSSSDSSEEEEEREKGRDEDKDEDEDGDEDEDKDEDEDEDEESESEEDEEVEDEEEDRDEEVADTPRNLLDDEAEEGSESSDSSDQDYPSLLKQDMTQKERYELKVQDIANQVNASRQEKKSYKPHKRVKKVVPDSEDEVTTPMQLGEDQNENQVSMLPDQPGQGHRQASYTPPSSDISPPVKTKSRRAPAH
ncbi:hypothetical protein FRC14_004104 [Serendipita sp. 396]|nr:hypothetical protein FRC14_004104 [Serendipita sp. 396]KAG8782166.1 hypothetical protein FRC15_007416 [Serendipita sp. 397]KAG8798518.1 hypothetical protein FRC16_007105 [Serendipita sp. 398]KAG8866823.1 hypothetical protein FRC20_007415 [Serendipita sp. 405]